jgi:hypothetical protein
MPGSLFNFAFALKSFLLFWKLLAFKFLLRTSVTLLSSISVPVVKIVFLLDALQLLMLFPKTLTSLEARPFFVIVLNNDYHFILKY